jgi:hypothetical protein
MKTKSILLFTMIAIILGGCDNDGTVQTDPKTKEFIPLNADSIKLEPELEQALQIFNKSSDQKGLVAADSLFNDGYIEIPERFKKCLDSSTAPKGIRDLKYGMSLDAYKFDKSNQAKLGFLGFGNVDIEDNETVIVVEYKQTGTQRCDNLQLFYGVGARIMMQIKSKKRNAKVNTPQQISASVTFGRADVLFSVKTFGITGPGVARLIKSGTMTENTYVEFLNEISTLIVDAYSDTTKFEITPQPLFLKQQ